MSVTRYGSNGLSDRLTIWYKSTISRGKIGKRDQWGSFSQISGAGTKLNFINCRRNLKSMNAYGHIVSNISQIHLLSEDSTGCP